MRCAEACWVLSRSPQIYAHVKEKGRQCGSKHRSTVHVRPFGLGVAAFVGVFMAQASCDRVVPEPAGSYVAPHLGVARWRMSLGIDEPIASKTSKTRVGDASAEANGTFSLLYPHRNAPGAPQHVDSEASAVRRQGLRCQDPGTLIDCF